MKKFAAALLAFALLISSAVGWAESETTTDTGIWEKRFFVDDFGDPTDQAYYTTRMYGTFSNSATTNSLAEATILVDPSNEDASVAIILYEYGDHQVKNPYESIQEYEVQIKDTNGIVHSYEGYMYSDRIYLYDSEYLSWSPIEDIFARGGKIQFVIRPKDDKITKYSFTIEDSTGYANLFPITAIGPFSEGLATYTRGNRYSGYLDTEGTEVLPCRFVSAGSFDQGLAYTRLADVEDGTHYGFIDKTGEIIFSVKSTGITSFTEDGVAYTLNPPQAIDKTGNPISDLKGGYFVEGLAPVEDNGLWGFIDLNGTIIIPCEYDDVTYFNDGLAMVKQNEMWHCIDKTGNIVFSYDCITTKGFSDGLAMVAVGDESNPGAGYIDQNGVMVIPADFFNGLSFSNGRAPVSDGTRWAVIDKAGTNITDFDFTGIFGTFVEGMLPVQNESGKWGAIDINGTQVIPFEYDTVNNFTEGLARVRKGSKWGIIDRSGNEIIPCDYDDVMYGEGYFTLLKDREVTVKPRTDYQANYIREEEDYFQELSAKLVAEESAIEEAQRTKLMLMEYTDKETIQSVQTALNEAGYDCGTPDGIAGRNTQAAISAFQQDNGLNETGTATHELLLALGIIDE